MGVDLMRNHAKNASSSCYRSACKHPLLVFMIFVSIWLYQSFPVLFSLLLYASPVVASTLVLLGTLLYYGRKNSPEIHHRHHHIHNSGTRVLGNAESDRSRRNSAHRVHDTRSRIDEENKGWETGSNLVESSSLTASMADINSMLDELHPMSGSEGPYPIVSTDAASDNSLELSELVNDTDDYNNYDYDYDDDDEDESVITWTEDDQRNIMNLGTLELERNLLLENLVVRQTALKHMRMLAEKKLKNISPHLHSNATPISITSLNHFDHTNSKNDNNILFARSGGIPRGQKPDHVGPTFQFGSPLVNHRKSFDFDPSTFGPKSTGSSYRASDISEYIYQRRRFSEEDSTVNTGNEEKTSSKSNSSSFCDVTNDTRDDDNEEDEYTSLDSPMEHDSTEMQIDESGDDYSATINTEGGLSQRSIKVDRWLKSLLTGWKA